MCSSTNRGIAGIVEVNITQFGRVELDITQVPSSTVGSRTSAERFEDRLSEAARSHREERSQPQHDSAQAAKKNIQNSHGPEFMEWSIGQQWPKGEFDVVSMIDVLHHIPPLNKHHAIEEAVGHVKPGGLFLFKDIGIKPRWRAFFNSLHDLVLTGERVTYTRLDVVVSWAESTGIREVERRTINRLWYGHEMVLFSK